MCSQQSTYSTSAKSAIYGGGRACADEMFDGIGNFIGGGGGAVGGGAGGAMGGGRASTGFGKWYSDMQEAQEVC